MDKPHFPSSPPPRSPSSDPYVPAEKKDAGPIVVRRAEPPPEENASGPKAKLTHEEIRALLATNEVNSRGRRRAQVTRRFAIFLPVGLIDGVLHVVASSTVATVVSIVLLVAAVVWSTRPLYNQRGWD